MLVTAGQPDRVFMFVFYPLLCNLPNGASLFVLVPSRTTPLYFAAQSQIHQTALFHLAAWPLMCQAVVPTARALPSSRPLPLLRLMQPSPGTLLSPCLPDGQAPGSLHYDKTA